MQNSMKCEKCGGTGKILSTVRHEQTKKLITITRPCVCFISKVVSNEYPLLRALGEQYIEKTDPQIQFKEIGKAPNLLIHGDFDSMLYQIKALIMQNRFLFPKPRILFSRSMDIIHDYHVPQSDGTAQHISSLSIFDLIVLVFGASERNTALAPCMAQVVSNRKEEKKPLWIYLPTSRPTLASCDQEYSQELERIVSEYKVITISSVEKAIKNKSASKNSAANFKIS